ncbi:MAG: nitrous oxide reductase family maturation protein NosD, partial [Candidatus Hodarchaeota archaeon]
ESNGNNITNNEICGYDNGIPGSSASQNLRYKVDGVQAFISRGIFLDPSNKNIIANNRISGFTGTGVELLDSSENLIDGNEIVNSFGENENGVFLAGSNDNNITNNEIYGHNNSIPGSSASQNLRYKVDGVQAFISRGIFLDPSNKNIIANNTISNITGTGVELLNSSDNLINGNEISNNAMNGILLQDSNTTTISHNVIYNDDLYGVTLSYASNGNIVDLNDFIGNNVGGTSQIHDDGSGNQFFNNFLVDHDNTDSNNDNTSDNPYYIDGDASNTDSSPYSIPVQPLKELDLALADLEAEVDYESETLNLKNEGNWETVRIKLPLGYSVTNINVSSVYTDGFIYAEEAQVQNLRTLIVKFNRSELISYLAKKLENETFPIEALKLNVTGFLKGAFLKFYGYDCVKVLNSDGTEAAIDEKIESLDVKPTQIYIDQIVETIVDNPRQVIFGQIDEPQKPSGLTLSLLFAPLISAVVIRRFYFMKKF